tara:strand:- start:152 stop:1465 length:1314 start_codon:yes stop_codon:yes gene_type:complete
MIENLSILLQLFIFILFFSFPLNIFNKQKIFKNYSLSISDCYCLNIIFHLNLLLVVSFFDINQFFYFYTIIFITLFFNIFYLKKYLNFYLEDKKQLINFIFFFIIAMGLFLNIASEVKLEWDALAHWIWKTTNFYEDIGIRNIKNLPFAEYPHLGPYVWSFFWKNSIIPYEYFGRLFYLFFYIVSIFSIFNYFFKKQYLTKCFLVTFCIFLTFDAFIFSGYQEYLLFAILVIVSRFSFLFIREVKYIFILIFSSHLLMWIKDEGLFQYIIFTIPFILIAKFNNTKKLIILLITLSLPLIQFLIQKYFMGYYGFQADIINNTLIDLFNYKILFPKLFLITKYIIISMIKYKLWLINIVAIFAIFIYSQKYRSIFCVYWIILFLNISFLYAVYLHTPYFSEFLLKVTLDRLVFQTSGFYLPIFLILARKLFISSKNRAF